MSIRPILGLSLALVTVGAGLSAQEAGKTDPAPQDPKPAVQQSPGEKIAELTRRIEQLQREIAFVRERAQLSGQILRDKLTERSLEVKSIDAGTSVSTPFASAPPAMREMRRARLFSDAEAKQFGAEVVMTADGRPIQQGRIDKTLEYLGSFLPAGDPKGLQMRAVLELVRIESTAAQFPETMAEVQQTMASAVAELDEGKPWSEVVQKYSRGPLQEDGKVVLTRNNLYGLPLEMAAFATEEGKRTPVVPTVTGLAMLLVDKQLQGETRAADRVEGRLILVPYHPDPGVVDSARSRAALGQSDVAVRSAEMFEMLPPMYRPTDAQQQNDGKEAIEEGADGGTPDKNAPDKNAPDKATPGKVTPDKNAPVKNAPDKNAPVKGAPDKAPAEQGKQPAPAGNGK